MKSCAKCGYGYLMDEEKCPICNPKSPHITKKIRSFLLNMLKIIENGGSVGYSTKEIQTESKLRLNQVKNLLSMLKTKELIYHNYSEKRWRLIKYRREDEMPYNERMRWSAS